MKQRLGLSLANTKTPCRPGKLTGWVTCVGHPYESSGGLPSSTVYSIIRADLMGVVMSRADFQK